ncbi:hypothetical protein Tco_0798172 [Tanacetum coccineum]
MLVNRMRVNQLAHMSLDKELCRTRMSWLCAPTRAQCWFNLEWPHYNKHNMGKTVGELHAMLIEYEKGLSKKAKTPQVMMIKGGKIQKSNKKSLKAKAYSSVQPQHQWGVEKEKHRLLCFSICSNKRSDKDSYEVWYGNVPNMS